MVKNKILKNVAEKAEVSQKIVDTVLTAYTEVVTEILSKDKNEKVALPGIGTFSVKHVDERSGIVQLGESKGSIWTKPAHDEIVFKITKSVKELA